MKKTNNSGLTIVEILIVTMIIVLVIVVFSMASQYFFGTYSSSLESNRTISEAQISLKQVTAELREVKISEEGAYPLKAADDQELIFYADADNDGGVEQLRYFLNGTSFSRGIIEPDSPPNVYDPDSETVKVISDYVVNGADPVFYYYDGDWPGDAVNNPLVPADRLLETRMIEVRLVLNTSPQLSSNLEVSSKTMLRNLKTNY